MTNLVKVTLYNLYRDRLRDMLICIFFVYIYILRVFIVISFR